MSESIWKKEIRLRKKPEPLPPLPAHLLERSRLRADRPKGTVTIPVIPDRAPTRVERWTAPEPAPQAERPATVEFPKPAVTAGPDTVSLLPVGTAVDRAPVAPELPKPATTYGWTKPLDEPAQAPVVTHTEPVAVKPEPVEVEPELEPVGVEPEPEPVAVAPEPEPAEPPPATEEKVPLLKREISFKRQKKEKPAKPVVEKTPLLKHEFSLKRKKAEETAVADPVVAEPVVAEPVAQAPAEAAEKTPLLKRELSFKRTPKPKAEKPAKSKKEKPPKAERTSPLKRELHLPRPSRKPKAEPGHKVERVIGLHIGSSQLAAAHVLNNGHAELVQLAQRPLDRGLVVDGEVRDTAALTRALKEFFAANKLPRKDVRLGIASSRIGVRILEVPSIDDPKQFENAIRFRAQELLPIPVTDAILDHVVLGEHENDEGDVLRRVLLVFAHRDLVSRFVETCRGAGVRLSGVDLDAFALLRAVGAPDGDGGRAVVAVSIGHERTVLAVSDGTICDFTRVLEWGGSSLDVALARAIDLTPSQAEPIKQALSLDADTAPEGLTPMQLEAAKAALRTEVGVLGRELVSSLRFYQSRPDSLAIGEVLLAGGASQLGGLSGELQRLLGAPVRLADPFGSVTLGKKVVQPESPSSLAVAVGLGIEA